MRREEVDGSQRKARRQRAPLLLVASGATSNANTLKPFSSVTQLQEKQQRDLMVAQCHRIGAPTAQMHVSTFSCWSVTGVHAFI